MRIADFLLDKQVAFETLPHAPAFTAQKLAKYLRVPGSKVAKCVLLHGPEGYFLALLPASRRIDTHKLSLHLSGPVRISSRAELVRVFKDCEWGAVSPLGVLYGLPVILDVSLSPESEIVVEAQSHVEAIRIRCHDLEKLVKPDRLAFADSFAD